MQHKMCGVKEFFQKSVHAFSNICIQTIVRKTYLCYSRITQSVLTAGNFAYPNCIFQRRQSAIMEINLENFPRLGRKEQEKIKPRIEDVINIHLDGDMRKNALDFIAYVQSIQSDGKPFRWVSINKWRVDLSQN